LRSKQEHQEESNGIKAPGSNQEKQEENTKIRALGRVRALGEKR